jgi:hypothetical protein
MRFARSITRIHEVEPLAATAERIQELAEQRRIEDPYRRSEGTSIGAVAAEAWSEAVWMLGAWLLRRN